MAKQNQFQVSFSLDRRQLLTTTATITVAGVLPRVPALAGTPAEVAITPASLSVSHPLALNVCASTARRIEEIAARNRIRQEAGLPLLSIPQELRRMKTVDVVAAFERFAAVDRQAVWGEILAPVRAAKGDPHWRPRGMMEGLGYQSRVSKVLRERFQAARASPNKITISC